MFSFYCPIIALFAVFSLVSTHSSWVPETQKFDKCVETQHSHPFNLLAITVYGINNENIQQN